MRIFGLAVVALVAGLASPACAQSAYDGPLAAPDAPVATPPRHAKPKPKPGKAHHAAARPTVGDAFDAPAPSAAASGPPARKAPADDPLSLGMSWNGNNDSVAQTRSQNLDGNAFGSGAEVGMKLHF